MSDSTPLPQAEPVVDTRQFTGRRKVRLGDVLPCGRLRLDALTRYAQDLSDDDTTDAGLPAEPAWVVRRTVVDVIGSARLAETLTITTFCSGLGGRWAERRLRMIGDGGARYEVATLWICVDPVSGRPQPLTEQFLAIYGPAADGRRVRARLLNDKPPPDPPMVSWPLRLVDFDTLGHVNNAAYWAVVEEFLPTVPEREPFRVSIEYGSGLPVGAAVSVSVATSPEACLLWWFGDDGDVAASVSLRSLPGELYRAGLPTPSPGC